HALRHLAPRARIEVEAATVDHGLRASSAADALNVKRHCDQLGMACQILAVDVGAHRGPHVSLQDAARRARLAALRTTADARGCDHVALAHTADDQAETVLFRIVRGTRVRGLAGIPYRREGFIRPLLDVRRTEVLRYLRKLRVEFLDDPSNHDVRHTRSRVRGGWLPFLTKENPRVVEALLALADDARRMPLQDEPHEAAASLPRDTRKTLQRLVARPRGTHLISSSEGLIEVVYGRVAMRDEPRPYLAGDAPDPDACVPLMLGKALPWEVSIDTVSNSDYVRSLSEIEATLEHGVAGPPRGGATFAAEIGVNGLRVRRFRPGDRMRPRGGRGSRKLQDLFVDAKIPRFARGKLPVVTDAAGTILYVPGLRPAEEGRPSPQAQRWIEIRVR
ncbi:MAG TPA: tRNA lysidine(34) synthetase TilS, partial [Polyangia bacterium]